MAAAPAARPSVPRRTTRARAPGAVRTGDSSSATGPPWVPPAARRGHGAGGGRRSDGSALRGRARREWWDHVRRDRRRSRRRGWGRRGGGGRRPGAHVVEERRRGRVARRVGRGDVEREPTRDRGHRVTGSERGRCASRGRSDSRARRRRAGHRLADENVSVEPAETSAPVDGVASMVGAVLSMQMCTVATALPSMTPAPGRFAVGPATPSKHRTGPSYGRGGGGGGGGGGGEAAAVTPAGQAAGLRHGSRGGEPATKSTRSQRLTEKKMKYRPSGKEPSSASGLSVARSAQIAGDESAPATRTEGRNPGPRS